MKLIFEKEVLDIMQGAIDMHIHSGPDVYPRILNVMEISRHAQENGLTAILLKNHFFETAGLAQTASDETGFLVFGSISLNLSVGGLNVHAVDSALKLGAKIVWLPTLHAPIFIDYFKQKKDNLQHLSTELNALSDIQGIYLLNDDGNLKEELYPIFDLIAKADAILATGHASMEEAKVVVREAAKSGVKKIIVTHPEARFLNNKLKDVEQLLELGATYLECCYCCTTRQVVYPRTPEELYDFIRHFGAEYCIMSTDSGQWLNPLPVQQMGMYIKDMLTFGFSEQEIRTMVSDNPLKILGI